MSSKVLPPDNLGAVQPFAWRRVEAGREEDQKAAAEMERQFHERLSELEQLCERRVREARAEGQREGEAVGRKRAAAELEPVIARLARSIDEVARLRAGLRKEAEGDLVRLALAIAQRILRRQLAVDPEALHGLVLAALEKLQGQEISRVKVHPSHAAAVAAALPPPAGGPPVEVIPDPSCEVGGVVFETTRGNLDASFESQLREIERGLADCLRRSS
jgi:flagellar assembly protein FliH